jgi:hypothetical protein
MSALDKFASRFYLPPRLPLEKIEANPVQDGWFPNALDAGDEYVAVHLVRE